MQRRNLIINIFMGILLLCGNAPIAFAQATGTLRGTVRLETSDTPLHNVIVTITQLKRAVETDESGAYEFKNVPPGIYDVVAELDRVPNVVKRVTVSPN